MGRIALLGLWLLLASAGALAAEDESAFDRRNAEEINRVCAACHGEYGQGGGGGVYPRLAGLPASYMAEQIRKFKDKTRLNIPMAPFANDRELPDEDVRDVTRYLAGLKLNNRMPNLPENMDGLERLKIAKQVVQIPRHDAGEAKAGEAAYQNDCALCHGKDGYGKKKTPLVAGQFIPYLLAQIEHFRKGEREHEDAEPLFKRLTGKALDDMMHYLSLLDD